MAERRGATDRISTLTAAIGLAAALEAFCAAKAAEGLSPRSIVWYRMIGERLVRRFGAERPVDALTPTELRGWLVELRATLSPMSVAGYVRGLRAFGSWLSTDGLAAARALRGLARPRVRLLYLADQGGSPALFIVGVIIVAGTSFLSLGALGLALREVRLDPRSTPHARARPVTVTPVG